jgi:hypothetical protein
MGSKRNVNANASEFKVHEMQIFFEVTFETEGDRTVHKSLFEFDSIRAHSISYLKKEQAMCH